MTTLTQMLKFNVAEIYANANSFKIVGVKSNLYVNALNIHVDVSAIDNNSTAFNTVENLGSWVTISVCDSHSPNGNPDCWAENNETDNLSNNPAIIALVEMVLETLRTQNDKPLHEKNYKDLDYAVVKPNTLDLKGAWCILKNKYMKYTIQELAEKWDNLIYIQTRFNMGESIHKLVDTTHEELSTCYNINFNAMNVAEKLGVSLRLVEYLYGKELNERNSVRLIK